MPDIKPPLIKYDDASHRYWLNDVEVPSVTTILDGCTPKDALPWWGMRVGLAGVLRLVQAGKVSTTAFGEYDADDHLSGIPSNKPGVKRGNKDKTPLEALIIENKLSTNHVRDQAADRGTEIHEAIQKMGIDDVMPAFEDFDPQFRPYLRAFSSFWLDQDPEFVEQEVMVAYSASDEDVVQAYAGRYDLKARIAGQLLLIDFKTSKGIYGSHFEQLRLYDIADRWIGAWVEDYEPTDRQAIVNLRADGTYVMEYADHVSRETAFAAVALHYARRADAAALKTRSKARGSR